MKTVRQYAVGFVLIAAAMLLLAGCDGDARDGRVAQGFSEHDAGTSWTFAIDSPDTGPGTQTHAITGTQTYRGRETLVLSETRRFADPANDYDGINLLDAEGGNVVVRDLHGARTEYEPDSGFYAFPLAVGKTWRATYTVRQGQDEHEQWEERQVAAYEEVTVPAGTFMAFRVDMTAASYDGPEVSYWYAPAVGYVVKFVVVDYVVELGD